jgi:hypothetical protein
VKPSCTRDALVPPDLDARRRETSDESLEIRDDEGRVSLLGGSKIVLDTQVDLHAGGAKPHASTYGKSRWFGHFGEAENLDIEPPARVFGPAGDRELHVLKTETEGSGDRWGRHEHLS